LGIACDFCFTSHDHLYFFRIATDAFVMDKRRSTGDIDQSRLKKIARWYPERMSSAQSGGGNGLALVDTARSPCSLGFDCSIYFSARVGIVSIPGATPTANKATPIAGIPTGLLNFVREIPTRRLSWHRQEIWHYPASA
jgi:hypothetical protein